MELKSSDSQSPQEGSQQGACSPNHLPKQPSQYTPTKLCTSLEQAKEVAASHVLSVLNIEHAGSDVVSNNIGTLFVTDDVTNGVAAMSLSGGARVKAYPAVYGNAETNFGTYSIYNGVYSSSTEGYPPESY